MRIHHVAFRTDDLPRLGAFYETVLGLPVRKRDEDRIWVGAGEVVLMLERRESAEPRVDRSTRELVTFAIATEDRRAWEQRLAEHAIEVEERTDYTLYFRDPDGRRVGVSSYAF